MAAKRVILTSLVTLVGIGGIISGAILLRNRQDIREKAAVPNGKAEVSLSPSNGSFDVGETFPVSINFNTGTTATGFQAISGISVRVTYPYNGASPEVTASNVKISPSLLSSGDWSCPTNTVTESGGNVNIDIACANISASGYTATTDTLLATFDMTVNRTPSTLPLVVRFDSSNSVVTSWSNGEDILTLPQSVGSYSVSGSANLSPTVTTSVTPTGTLTITPTKTLTVTTTPSPTKTASSPSGLPDAGVSFPTVVGLGAGVIAIFAALAFAL